MIENEVNNKWSVKMADSVMYKFPELRDRWAYDYGVLCRGMERVFIDTTNLKYFNYIKDNMDHFTDEAGNMKYYQMDQYNLDFLNNGKTILYLYKETNEQKYKLAVDRLRQQIVGQPRTSENGFWHKKIYPHQMWLDGLYMSSPFYAEYSLVFNEEHGFDDVAKQFLLVEKHLRDPETGLFYHGWDESREQRWSNKVTGCSPHFWGRAMGWFSMALVDVLDYIPSNHKNRQDIIQILQGLSQAITAVQDDQTGVWFQVLDRANDEGNYMEASCTCMFTYALAKAVRKGYIDKRYLDVAQKAFHGIIQNFIEVDQEGYLNLHDTVYCSGLGGNPYRDGSYDYYISERKETNNLLGIGAFLQASAELNV